MLEEQFVDLRQQQEAYKMGMWAFLGSEMMLFGGLFLAYTVGRISHYDSFVQGSHELHRLLGGLNTAVLLTSSATMAFAVERSKLRRWGSVVALLLVTAVLGLAFIGIKTYEWSLEYNQGLIPGAHFSDPGKGLELFYWFYFVMTGLHAIHLTIGVGAVLTTAWLLHRRSPIVLSEASDDSGEPPSPIVMLGLYWHLIDLIWVFLYPALYLVRGGP
jgi:cytochrome c oxidase subunit 3